MGFNSSGEFHFDSYPQRIFVASILSVVFFLGVFGNGLVILAVLVSHRLRDVTNVFVVNLAVADFLTCLCVPANIIALVSPITWPFKSMFICTVAATVTYTSIGVSLYNLASLAVIRCILMTQSLACYTRIFQNKFLIIVWIFLLWFVPAMIVMLPVSFSVDHLGYDPVYHSCTDSTSNLPNPMNERTKDAVLAIGFFFLPTVVLIVAYWKIYKHVMIHSDILKAKKGQPGSLTMKDLKRVAKSVELSSGISRSVSRESLSRVSQPTTPVSGRYRKHWTGRSIIKSNLSRRQLDITKNLFYVVCAFLVCITPYVILLIFDDTYLAPFAPYAACFLVTNSCINWIIYATKHPHFKVVIRCLLKRQWDEIPEPVKW